MTAFGAILMFWGVLAFAVGAPSFAYFCNVDSQKNEEEKTTLKFLCISLGIVIIAVVSGVVGCMIVVPPHP